MKKPIPRISTRGYYNRENAKAIKNNKYFLYPKKSFSKIIGKKEIAIMIHGLRNDSQSAVNKFEIAEKRLKQLGYTYPVVGFSYDANTKGAHLKKSELKALRVGQTIAKKNGRNLCKFILDFKKQSPKTKIRLIGHSLGTQVILSAVENLFKSKHGEDIIESAYFFGSSLVSDVISSKKYQKILHKIIKSKIVNYFAPSDEVLKYAHTRLQVINPLGLKGAQRKTISKFTEKKVKPKNHRFVSYAAVLTNFP